MEYLKKVSNIINFWDSRKQQLIKEHHINTNVLRPLIKSCPQTIAEILLLQRSINYRQGMNDNVVNNLDGNLKENEFFLTQIDGLDCKQLESFLNSYYINSIKYARKKTPKTRKN